MAARDFRDQVGGRRRDDDKIGIARQADMADIEFALRIEQVGIGRLAGERAGRERRYEMLRGGGENAAYLRAALLQTSDQVERFIGRDASADDEEDARAFGRRDARLVVCRLRGRFKLIETLAASIVRGRTEDDSDLVFHGSAVPRRAQAQQLLELVVELADGETGHWRFPQ